MGTSFEHYRYYNIWIDKTLGARKGNTVFFKQKYLTMPTNIPGDALLKAAVELKETIEKKVSKTLETEAAMKTLMEIFKSKAATEVDPMQHLRQNMQKAARQRADNEAVKVVKTSESAAQQRVIAPEPEPEILLRVQQDCDSDDDMAEPIISYQEHENWDVLDGLAQNTRAQS